MAPFPMMITLTFNPALDETWSLETFDEIRINRVGETRIDAGGKGVNVSSVLHTLGLDAPATGFAGGENGACLRSLLQVGRIPDEMVDIAGETRRNLTLQIAEGGRTIKINHPGPRIRPVEFDALRERVEKQLSPGDRLAVCGGMPAGIDSEEAAVWLGKLSRKGIGIVVDSEAFDLTQLVRIHPAFVKINQMERMRLAGGDDDILTGSIARTLDCPVVVSKGSEGAAAHLPDGRTLRLGSPRIRPVSTVGAGDAMLAGMLYVLYDHADLDAEVWVDALRMGVAAGAAKAETPGTGMPARDRILALYEMTAKTPIK